MIELAQMLLIAASPAAGGLIGWGTNLLAVEMLFGPVERKGLGWFGWQGVIPAQAEVMAGGCADLLERLVEPTEIGQHVEAAAETLCPVVEAAVLRSIEASIARERPRLWRALPARARRSLLERARRELPQRVPGVVRRLSLEAQGRLDLRELIVSQFRAQRGLLGELFRLCGEAEFRFVILTGLVCGFFLGLLQLLAWATVGLPAWLFPVIGAITGGTTNWLALWLVFSPQEPVQVGPWRVQGLFLKRQREVSQAYASFFAHRVLTPSRLLEQARVDELLPELERQAGVEIDRWRAEGSLGRRVALRAAGGDGLCEGLPADVLRELPALSPLLERGLEAELDLEPMLRERLEGLSPSEFVGVLRPVFQAEEWKLTAIGAGLGAVAGLVQAGLLFLI